MEGKDYKMDENAKRILEEVAKKIEPEDAESLQDAIEEFEEKEVEAKPKKKRLWVKTIFLLLAVAFIAVVIGAYLFYPEFQTIMWMRSNNIQIWGLESCPWCQKQRAEFFSINWMKQQGLYMSCDDITNQEVCSKLPGVPAWTSTNETIMTIIGSGYIPLDELVQEIQK